MNEKKKIAEYKRKVLRSMYSTHSIREIAEYIGCRKDSLYKLAKQMQLSHNQETLSRIKNIQYANLSLGHTRESIEKRVKTRKRTIRMERLRILSGEKQQTKLKVIKMPNKTYHAKYNLIYRHGYFPYENEPYVLGYDQDTRRVEEEYFKKKYGLSFEEDLSCLEV